LKSARIFIIPIPFKYIVITVISYLFFTLSTTGVGTGIRSRYVLRFTYWNVRHIFSQFLRQTDKHLLSYYVPVPLPCGFAYHSGGLPIYFFQDLLTAPMPYLPIPVLAGGIFIFRVS
jgi:hypothetical protein